MKSMLILDQQNISESLQSRSLDFRMPWDKFKFNKRVDYTNSTIRLQASVDWWSILLRGNNGFTYNDMNLPGVATKVAHQSRLCWLIRWADGKWRFPNLNYNLRAKYTSSRNTTANVQHTSYKVLTMTYSSILKLHQQPLF